MTSEEQTDLHQLYRTIVTAIKILGSVLVVQAVGAIWWAATLDNRVLTIEEDIAVVKSQTAAGDTSRIAALDRLSRVEADYGVTKLEIQRRLDRIEQKIDRLIEAR